MDILCIEYFIANNNEDTQYAYPHYFTPSSLSLKLHPHGKPSITRAFFLSNPQVIPSNHLANPQKV